GVMTGEWKSYVDPQDYFDRLNVSIHGIEKNIVAGAPAFGGLVNTINGLLNGQVVVTHTSFDKVAIYQACKKCKAIPPSCTWLDSASVVRRTWTEFSRRGYGLQNVCASIGYKYQAHDALEDAKAVGNIMLAATTQTGFDLDGWLARVRQPIDPTFKQRVARDG